MERFKGFTLIFVLLLLVLGFQDYASAHSGRTDSSGGHNCSAKSIEKGLCTGYHYHNGGSSSSSSNSGSSSSTPKSTTPKPSDKDCDDFSSYDEVVEYWNNKGYSKDYDPERLDGRGNTVDDGIPCEPPSTYDISKINNSSAQIAKKEEGNGKDDGYSIGYKDGFSDKSKNASTDKGSVSYKDGYENGYLKGYNEGQAKFESEKKTAEESGYAFGKQNDELKVPSNYSNNKLLSVAFEEGFNKAIEEKVKKKEQEYNAAGYEDGKNDEDNSPNDVEESYVESYKEGFNKGQTELMESYITKGYEDAFILLKYKEPSLEKPKYIDWYKQGFQSNKEVLKIQDLAYEMGLKGEEMVVPEDHIASKEIYEHHYKVGLEEYKEQQREDAVNTSLFFGVLCLGWLSRRFYVAKKMVA
ncbi:YHYH domain-containing protein [Halobacillus sp. H74]|uniref:YHYH domain-containing protein n=1 Tax=Halobacillus sp. H74 TaxID=3457436 RepID=UPI003FCE870F